MQRLWVRTYSCIHCGMVKDRDENAGMNILLKGLQILSQRNETDSLREQLHEVKQTGCISPTLEKGSGAKRAQDRRSTLSRPKIQNSRDAVQQCEADL